MVLTAASLSYYLLERGLVSSSSLVDGDFRVRDLSRRNRVFRVERGPHPGYIVKQVKDWKQGESLEREALFYSRMRTDLKDSPLRRFLPQCYSYDAENQVLVLELAAGQALERRDPASLSMEHAQALGDSLRSWHQEASELAADLRGLRTYDPWILSFHRQSEDHFRDLSAANAELLRLVKRDEAFGLALDALRQQWQAQTLIHGDMKWPNCLVSAAPATQAPRFIDWELAGWGDPLWDAAGILQEYLALWSGWEKPVEEIAPAMGAFWESYEAGESKDRQRAVGYAAARLIQTAFEQLQRQESMTAPAIRILQAALNILTAPDQAIAVFWG
jgi:aminoglycoside phosphotransferase (APT) family kinase protein